MAIDLEACVPEELATSAQLEDIDVAVGRISKWLPRHAEVLDYLYQRWGTALLETASDVTDIEPLASHLRRVAHSRRRDVLNCLGKAYADRWQFLADLLERRLAALESPAPARLLENGRFAEIVKLVATGEVGTQLELQSGLGLKKANCTRILNALEDNRLVMRRRDGRENRLVLGENARPIADSRANQPRPWSAELSLKRA